MNQCKDFLARFPLELIGKICDELRHHKGTLVSASLTSRSFLPFCRPYLFHTLKVPLVRDPALKLWDRDIASQTADLCFLTESSVTPYVRDLEVELPLPLTAEAYTAALISFLKKLLQIQVLFIRGAALNIGSDTWAALPSSLSTVFLDILGSHPITSLGIYDINDFPPQLFRSCRLLKCLILDKPIASGAPCSLGEESDAGLLEKKVELESLQISAKGWLSQISDSLFALPHSPICLSKLVHLKVHVHDLDGHKACRNLIESSKDSLEDLELRILGPKIIFALSRENSIKLHGCEQLQYVSISTLSLPATNPLPWIKSLLETVQEDSGILGISLSLGSFRPSLSSWMALDSFLTGPRFPRLGQLLLPTTPPQPTHKIPLLISKGIVEFLKREFEF